MITAAPAESLPSMVAIDRSDPASVARGRVVPPLVLPKGWDMVALRLPEDAGLKISRHLRGLEAAYPASPSKPGVGLALVVRLVRNASGEWTAQVTPEVPTEHIGR